MQPARSAAPALVAPAPVVAAPPSGKKLGDKAGVVVASRVVVAVAQLAAVLGLVRLLPKEQFGLLNFCLMLYQTVAGLAVAGVPQGLLYFLPQLDPARRKAFVRLTTIIMATMGLTGAVIIVVLAGPLSGRVTPSPRDLLPLLALYIALDIPTLALPNLLIGLDRAPLAARLNMLSAVISASALVVPAALGLRLPWVLGIFAASAGLRLAIYLSVVAWAHRGVRATRSREHLRPLVHFSLPLGLGSAVGLLNQQIDKYLIALSFAATTVLADYTVGATELPLVSVLPYTVATVLMPTFVEHWKAGRPTEVLRIWHASILKVALVMLPLFVLFFVAAESYVTLLFTEKYMRATGPMRIYLLLLPLRVTAYSVILQAVGDTRAVLEITIVGLLLNALGSALGIATIGFLGPAFAAVAVQALLAAMLLYRIGQHMRVGVRKLFPWRGYLRVVLLAVATAPVAWLVVRALAGHAAAALGLGAAAYLAVYFVAGSLTGVISPADRGWLLEKLRWWRREETS